LPFKTRVLGVILENREMCIENLYIKLFFNPYYVIKCINIEFEFNQKLRVFSKKRGMCIKSVFDSVVAGAFQITFRAKIHAMMFFHFLKIIFDISTSK
jgi:hypothetical protein